MSETPTTELPVEPSDEMTPEAFASISEKILVRVFGTDADVYITDVRLLQDDPKAVANYLWGAVLAAHKQDEYIAAMTDILESDDKTA